MAAKTKNGQTTPLVSAAEKISIKLIDNFPNHPFYVFDDDMFELTESIRKNGLISPVIVRKKYDRYEMISGHRRKHACEILGHTYSSDEVKKMIERQKKKYGWEFLFIGANIDAVSTATKFGIGADRAVNYRADSRGTEVLFNTVSETVCCMRENQPLTADWSRKIDEDNKKRICCICGRRKCQYDFM